MCSPVEFSRRIGLPSMFLICLQTSFHVSWFSRVDESKGTGRVISSLSKDQDYDGEVGYSV